MAATNDFAALWVDARNQYEDITHKKLESIPIIVTTGDLIARIDAQNQSMESFRKKSGRIFTMLSAVCEPIELVGNLAAGAASQAFPPSSMVFGAVMYFVNAAKGVSASLDAVTELLSTLKDFTVRLEVYHREQLSQELRKKLTDILITVIEILARSTKLVDDGIATRFKAFSKSLVRGNDMKMPDLLTKIGKLTESEDKLVGAETLVEAKKMGRNVEAVQGQLNQLEVTSTQTATSVGQILSAMEDRRADRDTQYVEAVKAMLRPSISPQDRFDEIKRECVVGSGNWIRAEEAMKSWMACTSPLLWISGGPGSGKSFLTFSIISKLQELNEEPITGPGQEISAAWFYFRDNNSQTRSIEQALRDMAHQISQTDVQYAQHVANLARSGAPVSSIRSAWQRLFVDYFIVNGEEVSCNTYLVLDAIDEAFEDDRITFFGLLRDVQSMATNSRLHLVMLGRPQLINEIVDGIGKEIPTIYVDWTKNSSDIAHYIELSIEKSRVLNRLSRALKDEVIQALSTKADGMFLWVRLMLTQLATKSRVSAIREALGKAPKGLTEMLRHVLEGLSDSLKDEEEADDLNDVLMWVTLAERPLYLGEIDSMLRLKSDDGDGVLDLEKRLRKQFATLFVLTRDDTLTTADLQASRDSLDLIDEPTPRDIELGAKLDDMDNILEFRSNPRTTTIAFAHASIGDFFRDEREGKITTPGHDCPPIGVDLHQAKLHIARSCLEILTDDNLLTKMKDSVNLRDYAAENWFDHLDKLDPHEVTNDQRANIAILLVHLIRDEERLLSWIGLKGWGFFSVENAKTILAWITDPLVIDRLDEDMKEWIKSQQTDPRDLWLPSMRVLAAVWLRPRDSLIWNPRTSAIILTVLLKLKEGLAIDETYVLTAEDVETTARWASFEENAEWHRSVGRTLRDSAYHQEAAGHFESALKLDPTSYMAITGLASTYSLRELHDKAIPLLLKAITLAEADVSKDPKHQKWILLSMVRPLAFNYRAMTTKISHLDGDMTERYRLQRLAFESFRRSVLLSEIDEESMWTCLAYLRAFACPPWKENKDSDVWKNRDLPEQLSELQCSQQTVQLLHDLERTDLDEEQTLLDAYLHKSRSWDSNFKMIAQAALEVGEVRWLQDRYKHAITLADKRLQPVTAAYLGVCLGELYAKYDDNTEKAVQIWENIATQGSTSTRVTSDIHWARTNAVALLGSACLRQALRDESTASVWISKMEGIAKLETDAGVRGSIPRTQILVSLAAWYRQQGRVDEARNLVRPLVKSSLAMLSDDDPNKEWEGWFRLVTALLAIADDVNVNAVLRRIRKYDSNGLAVFANACDSKGSDEVGAAETDRTPPDSQKSSPRDIANIDEHPTEGQQNDAPFAHSDKHGRSETDDTEREDEDDDSFPFAHDVCDGVCAKSFISYDGCYTCRFCTLTFCSDCYVMLAHGTLPTNICDAHHTFVKTPTTVLPFKQGEILVENAIMPITEWRTRFAKEWDISEYM